VLSNSELSVLVYRDLNAAAIEARLPETVRALERKVGAAG
jgi:hypothetical protein